MNLMIQINVKQILQYISLTELDITCKSTQYHVLEKNTQASLVKIVCMYTSKKQKINVNQSISPMLQYKLLTKVGIT